jgi:tRNA A37 threonylcarbamoyladenosine dehydratase
MDHVAESNINRQIHALEATLGMAKVLAMKERISHINPECIVHMVDDFVSPENWIQLIHDLQVDSQTRAPVSAVIDACDQVKSKVAMADWALRQKIFLSRWVLLVVNDKLIWLNKLICPRSRMIPC